MDTHRAAPPYSLWFSVRYGCRKCRPVTALWQLMAVPLFLPLPFCHEFNPLTIASLRRVVAGLNRCGTFRIQQQVLHSDAGSCVPVFLIEVPLFIRYRLNVRHGIHRWTSFQARYIKMNVSLPVCSAINQSLHKDNKIFWGFQIRTNSRQCVQSCPQFCLWCRCVNSCHKCHALI